MVRDLHMNIELVVCPIIREEDGLAMSSRNTYLSDEARKQSVVLNQSLLLAEGVFNNGENSTNKLIKIIADKINEMPLAEIDYVSIYDYPSLKVITKINQQALAAVAVKFGNTRLIDNIILKRI